MFKNVISSLNGSNTPAQVAAADLSNDEDDQTQQQSNNNNNNNNLGGQRRKKGGHKKRLASMMNKIHRLGGGRKSPSGGSDHNHRHLNVASDDDEDDDEVDCRGPHVAAAAALADEDDDEDYKTAEEACRKMSLNESSGGVPGAKYDAQTSKKQMELHKQQQQQHRPSLAGSEKFLLPEELSDIPTFLHTKNCDRALIDETRRLLKERYTKNPDNFYDADYKRMLTDDWTVSRFLLRRRLDPRRTAKLMEECGRFRKQYKMSEVELWEFPIEFHKAGGLFQYAQDRVGNVTMYMRVKMYRRVPEISDVFKAFILCVLERCDVANNGRGTAVIFDLSGCGLQNVDLGFLSWLLSSFRNYCPKGVSYILVYNLPWILNATCKLAMTWMSASNKRALRFVYGAEIENFIPPENLPDYMGGQCKQNYRRVPAGSLPATEVCHRFDLTPAQALKIAELFKEYLDVPGQEVEYEQVEDAAAKEERLKRQRERIKVDSREGLKQATVYGDVTKAIREMQQEEMDDEGTPGQIVDLVSQATKFIAH